MLNKSKVEMTACSGSVLSAGAGVLAGSSAWARSWALHLCWAGPPQGRRAARVAGPRKRRSPSMRARWGESWTLVVEEEDRVVIT